MRCRFLVLSTAVLLFVAVHAAALPFDKGGISGVGARSWGMGGAVVAQEGDTSTLWSNPAGIYLLENYDLYYQYGSLLGASSIDNVVAQRGHLPEWDLAYGLGYRHLASSGGLSFQESTTLVNLALPFNDSKSLIFGANLKYYATRLDIAGGDASGYGLDFGFLYKMPGIFKPLTLGLAVMDFQSDLEWGSGIKDNPPQLVQVGASWRFDEATIVEFDSEASTDYIEAENSSTGFKMGVERSFSLKKYNLNKLLALRLGYLQSSALAPTSLAGLFTAGLGINFKGFRLDYAYLQDLSGLGETQRASLSYQFDPLSMPTPVPTPKPIRSPVPTPLASPVVPVVVTAPLTAVSLVPDFDIFAPVAQSRRNSVNFSILGGLTDLSSYTLTISKRGSAKPLRSIRGIRLPRDLRWDGRSSAGQRVPDGSYVVALRMLSKNGQVHSSLATVLVNTRKAELQLQAYPKIFTPGDTQRPVEFELAAKKLAGIPMRWELLIENLAGKRVKLFEGRGVAPEKIEWPGLDDNGQKVAPESLYYATYSLEMESGALSVTPRFSFGSDVSGFGDQSAIKVTLLSLKFGVNDEVVNLEDYRGLKEAADGVMKYGTGYLVQVLGYADGQEAADGAVGPLELSFLRAKAVKEYLIDSGGLDPDRVKAMGFGSGRPQGDDATDIGRAKNRRVDVILYTK